MKWYAIHTQSGHENKLKNAILQAVTNQKMEEFFGEIIVPEVEVEEKKDGKKRVVRKNLYPGYIFLQMKYTDESILLIKGIAFGRRPMLIGERKRFAKQKSGDVSLPSPISEQEIANIKRMIEDGQVVVAPEMMFEKGEMILIKDGPFAGFKAVIDDVKEGKEKLDVLVNIFGRSTPVELNFSQVERVED
ncbi:MAG: transcription termination/antitermination protein NusG [bacterium]